MQRHVASEHDTHSSIPETPRHVRCIGSNVLGHHRPTVPQRLKTKPEEVLRVISVDSCRYFFHNKRSTQRPGVHAGNIGLINRTIERSQGYNAAKNCQHGWQAAMSAKNKYCRTSAALENHRSTVPQQLKPTPEEVLRVVRGERSGGEYVL